MKLHTCAFRPRIMLGDGHEVLRRMFNLVLRLELVLCGTLDDIVPHHRLYEVRRHTELGCEPLGKVQNSRGRKVE